MERRKFSREFKLEAVRLVRDRGVTSAQASRDLGVHANVLRKWVRELETDPAQAFPGHGQVKPDQLEIDRLRKAYAFPASGSPEEFSRFLADVGAVLEDPGTALTF